MARRKRKTDEQIAAEIREARAARDEARRAVNEAQELLRHADRAYVTTCDRALPDLGDSARTLLFAMLGEEIPVEQVIAAVRVADRTL